MKPIQFLSSGAIVAAISLAWLATEPVSAAPVAAPLVSEYTFREVPINGLGLKSMADLRGKPVIIDFWGKR